MFLTFVLLIALALPPMWLFTRTRPVTDRVDALRRANALAWCAALFAGASAWIYVSNQGNGPPTLQAMIAGIATGSGVLMLAALVRFFVFRKPRQAG